MDLEISTIASPAGSTLRFESQQFEGLITANKKLREELQLAMDMQVKYEAFVKEVMFRKERELVETKQEISVLKEENKKLFEEMMQRFRLNESGAVQYLPIMARNQEGLMQHACKIIRACRTTCQVSMSSSSLPW